MTFQVADVSKPLASAGRVTHIILLGDDDSYIVPSATGRRIKLHKRATP